MVWQETIRHSPKVHTTISIDVDDLLFIKRNNLDLSKLVRLAIIRRRGEIAKEAEGEQRQVSNPYINLPHETEGLKE